jgi:6-phosphogluconolactonase
VTRERQSRLVVLADAQALAFAVADWILGLAIAKEGTFAIALSGGSTPRLLYKCLAESPFRDSVPWPRMHIFWGDERFVSRTDSRSNYGMARETLLSRVPIPAQNVHPIRTEGMDVEAAAVTYAHELTTFYGADRLLESRPLFDVTLLGLGTDGHIASLFPDTAVLNERSRWVAAVDGVEPEARITLTLPALESSRHVAFLVEGEGKRAIFERLREGDSSLPAARLRPIGEEVWFLDRSAAGLSFTTGSIGLPSRAIPATLHSTPRR